MMKYFAFAVLAFLLFAGCAPKPVAPVAVVHNPVPVSYQHEVQPIFNKRCVVCHSCYNAPCQLKMVSFEGVARGATKAEVYDTERLESAQPTRLYIDADSTAAWHEQMGFYPVTKNGAAEGFNDSMLISLLDAKRRAPRSVGHYSPETDALSCPEDHDALERYLDDHPNRGMPYGFPPLSASEFKTVAQWLAQGAKGPDAAQLHALRASSPEAARQIRQWEAFLNNSDPKHVMTARYLYEHLFLAHIHFKNTADDAFYELVRSTSPSPDPINIIPTVRPYDDPGKVPFYYRFRKILSTIVHKTHMVFSLDAEELLKVKKRFIDVTWPTTPARMDYDPKRSANPFVIFEQIPASARYAWLLDHSEYIIRTFIRGPVCKGQVALNVINDQFWVMFLDPKYDLSLRYPNLLNFASQSLSLPTEQGSDFPAYRLFSDRYIDRAIDFYKKRERFYATIYTDGLGYDAVWPGAEADDAPLLSVYRHYDSASVHKGALGNLPKTLWVIDYPLFERIYYALVAGYDVFGNIGHQTNVRRYMDRLRVEGESYFLDFMPASQRKALFASWNANLNLLVDDKLFYRPSRMPAAIAFTTEDAKREFTEHIVDEHLLKETGIAFDLLNYFYENDPIPQLPAAYRSSADYIQAFRALNKPGTNFIRIANGNQSNVAYVHVQMPGDEDDVYFSVVINRWHDNVAFMFDEKSRLNPARDNADFIFDFIGSYPNVFVEFALEEAPEFFDMLKHFQDTPQWRKRFFHFAITRDDPKFWEVFDRFQKQFETMHPLEAGLFDLNRYYDRALPEDTNGTVSKHD